MEQISLETITAFRLPIKEQRRLYLLLALVQYRYQRHPNYNEKRLLECLAKDIKQFL
ncbi:MAG: hypothetical protein R3Y50_04470 [Rikenellaceae bacterium]